jgi:hypothetical protein
MALSDNLAAWCCGEAYSGLLSSGCSSSARARRPRPSSARSEPTWCVAHLTRTRSTARAETTGSTVAVGTTGCMAARARTCWLEAQARTSSLAAPASTRQSPMHTIRWRAIARSSSAFHPPRSHRLLHPRHHRLRHLRHHRLHHHHRRLRRRRLHRTALRRIQTCASRRPRRTSTAARFPTTTSESSGTCPIRIPTVSTATTTGWDARPSRLVAGRGTPSRTHRSTL